MIKYFCDMCNVELSNTTSTLTVVTDNGAVAYHLCDTHVTEFEGKIKTSQAQPTPTA